MNRQPSHNDRREIRVFISSTFRDMMRERDLLVKQVFPELRRKCAKRFATFTEVDLRRGITPGEAAPTASNTPSNVRALPLNPTTPSPRPIWTSGSHSITSTAPIHAGLRTCCSERSKS